MNIHTINLLCSISDAVDVSSSRQSKVQIDTDILSSEVVLTENKNERLNSYLSQLSQPPESKCLPEPIKMSKNKEFDNIDQDEVVTESKSVNGVCLQDMALKNQEFSNPGNINENRNTIENLTLPSHIVSNKNSFDDTVNSDVPQLPNDLAQNKDCLSTQIKKLSNAVQNESKLIQRRISSLEEYRSDVKNELVQPKEALQVKIPNVSKDIIERIDTSICSEKSPNIASPSITSIGKCIIY